MDFPALEWSGTKTLFSTTYCRFLFRLFSKNRFFVPDHSKKDTEKSIFLLFKKNFGGQNFFPESTHYPSRYPENLVVIELLCN